MKKLALTLATLGLLAAPVLACPNMEDKASEKSEETAPRTADKDKKAEQPKAKEQPKATDKKDEKKPADTAKKSTEKKPDKVSQR